MDIDEIVLAIVSIPTLLSISIYGFLAVKGGSATLISTVDSSRLTWPQKIFIGLSIIGFLVCMYSGAEALLSWMPEKWGHIDADGEYQTIKTSLAFIFASTVGIAFVIFIDKANHEKYFLEEIRLKCTELEKILEAADNSSRLEAIKDEYIRITRSLDSPRFVMGSLAKSRYGFQYGKILLEEQRMRKYHEFISLIEKQQLKLIQKSEQASPFSPSNHST